MNFKNINERQRFSLRKLTVGLASVLIGISIFGVETSQTAHAATTDDQPTENVSTTDDQDDVEIPDQPANPGDDIHEHVDYGQNNQSMTVHYKDQNGKEIGTQTVNGKTDTDTTFTPNYPDGWTANDSKDVPSSIHFAGDKTADQDITIKHNIDKINPGKGLKPGDTVPGSKDNKVPENSGLEDKDLNKSISQTVTIHKPDVQNQDGTKKYGDDTQNKQSIDYIRGADADSVTGKATDYTKWSAKDSNKTSFSEVDVPDIAGYTQSQKSVPSSTPDPNGDSKDTNIDITYTANNQSMNVVYQDADNNNSVVETKNYTGKTDQTLTNLNLTIPDGYTSSDKLPQSYTFTADKNQQRVVTLKHKIDQALDPKDVPDKDKGQVKNPDGKDLTESDYTKTITRTIKANLPATAGNTASVQDLSQNVTLTRTGQYDQVKKQFVSWNPWTTSHFDEVDAPVVDGYTPSVSKVDQTDVTSDFVDPKITITYSANAQKSYASLVDDDDNGKEISHIELTGVTDQTIDTGIKVPDGYRLTSGAIPAGYTFKAENNDPIIVHFKHVISPEIKPGNEPRPGDKIPGTNKDYPKDATDHKNFDSTVSRTVTITEPGKDANSTTQRVEFTRTATVDAVTGEIHYGEWTPVGQDSMSEIDAPVVNGYIASQKGAQLLVNVKQSDTPSDVNITYTKIGNFIPVNENGDLVPHTTTTPFVNDPDDASKVKPNQDVPTVPGYTPEKGATTTPTDPTKDQKIVYTANDGQQTINYVDEDGNLIGSQTLKGKTDETVNTAKMDNVENLDGWVISDKSANQSPDSVVIKANDTPIVVTVKHGEITLDHTQYHTKGDVIDGTHAIKYQDGVSFDDLNAVGRRTIEFNFPASYDPAKSGLTFADGTTNVIQTVQFTRNAVVDTVTGKVIKYVGKNEFTGSKAGLWDSNPDPAVYAKVLIPHVPGYKAKVVVDTPVTLGRNIMQTMFVSFFALPIGGFDNGADLINGQKFVVPDITDGLPTNDDKGQETKPDVKPIAPVTENDAQKGQKGIDPSNGDVKDDTGKTVDHTEVVDAHKDPKNKDVEDIKNLGKKDDTDKTDDHDKTDSNKDHDNVNPGQDDHKGDTPAVPDNSKNQTNPVNPDDDSKDHTNPATPNDKSKGQDNLVDSDDKSKDQKKTDKQNSVNDNSSTDNTENNKSDSKTEKKTTKKSTKKQKVEKKSNNAKGQKTKKRAHVDEKSKSAKRISATETRNSNVDNGSHLVTLNSNGKGISNMTTTVVSSNGIGSADGQLGSPRMGEETYLYNAQASQTANPVSNHVVYASTISGQQSANLSHSAFSKQLPQTGAKEASNAGILGALTGIIGMLGLAGTRKRKHN